MQKAIAVFPRTPYPCYERETRGGERRMLTMARVNYIREMYFEKGMSYAEISRETGHDVKTVKKYIYMEDFNKPPKPPKRTHSKLDPYKEEINSWLELDKQTRKKQRHTAKKVHDRLKKNYGEKYDCSYRLVATYVKERKREIYNGGGDFYLPLQHINGECQVDFGEADFYEKGIHHSGYYLNLSFPQSNAGYFQLFKGENFQCLVKGLKNIFSHIGGVPTRIWFDNPSTVVKNVMKSGERDLTESFQRFKNHYGFVATFCNPASGHEKGSVETKVGYHRRNFLVPVPEFVELELFNKELLEECDNDMLRPHYKKGIIIKELFEKDLEKFLPLPVEEFDESKLIFVKTNAHAKFTLNNGRHSYSTAPKYAKTGLYARLTAYEVIVLDESYREVKRHPRLYGEKRQESMDWLPYLTQLARRPKALKYSGIYSLFPDDIKEFLDEIKVDDKKQVLKVLSKISEDTDFNQALEALKVSLKHGARDVDSILATFTRLNTELLELDSVVLSENTPNLPSFNSNVNQYDELFLKGGKNNERRHS